MLDFLLAAVLIVAAAASWAYVRQERWSHVRALRAAQALCEVAQNTERVAVRLLRLTAHELRGIGMALQGHADCLVEPAGKLQAQARGAGLAFVAAQVQGLADELQDHVFPALAPRVLREELVDVAALLADAVAETAASLGPGLRNWRMTEVSFPTLLWADRRALRHILARVLTDAARSTGHGDWIDLSLRAHPEGLVLNVQDEGGGFATPGSSGAGLALSSAVLSRGNSGDADSRGIGLRLTLARSLMQAHGGRLEVEALMQVGCRVSLIFPAARLRLPEVQQPR